MNVRIVAPQQAVRAATQANDDAADGVARGLADEATAEGQADGDGAAGAAEGVTDEAAAVDLAAEAESSSQTDGSGAHEPAARARTRSAGLSIRSIRVLDKKYAVKNQVQAFTLACELLLKRHPERVSDVVSRHTYLSGELEAKSTFKQHARLTIHGETVYVGTNLKLQAVATLCKLLGLSESAVGFVDDRQQEHRYEGGRHVQLPADPASGMDELPDEDPVESSSDTMVAAAAETAMEDREPRSEAKEVSSSTGQDGMIFRAICVDKRDRFAGDTEDLAQSGDVVQLLLQTGMGSDVDLSVSYLEQLMLEEGRCLPQLPGHTGLLAHDLIQPIRMTVQQDIIDASHSRILIGHVIDLRADPDALDRPTGDRAVSGDRESDHGIPEQPRRPAAVHRGVRRSGLRQVIRHQADHEAIGELRHLYVQYLPIHLLARTGVCVPGDPGCVDPGQGDAAGILRRIRLQSER